MSTFSPKLAQIKVVESSDTRLVIEYHPVAYLVAGAAMLLLCLWAGIRYAGDSENPGWIAIVFGVIFFAAFGLLFYRRMTLTLDKSTGQITHYKRTMLVRRRTKSYPLANLTGVTVQTNTQGDGKFIFQRAILQFDDRDAVPMTTAMITGGSAAAAAEAINAWLTAARA